MSSRPQVEIIGFEAKFYDMLLNTISFGKYGSFIRGAISDIKLSTDEVVMDLGAGTGKNAELMLNRMGPAGKIYALEIGEEMRRQLEQRRENDQRITVINQRIEQPFQLPEKATLAFISFVIHGLQQSDRLKVVRNVRDNLAEGGRFCILDYNHFVVDEAPWYVQFGIRKLECKPTEEFINHDWPELLRGEGFGNFEEQIYFKGYLRLLCATKGSKEFENAPGAALQTD